ncbi:hypothetical protein KC318_g7734 [Hortaea werneckii]|nr:hypothetical protein KC334_g7889 [Hortaea werneckii]KAI7010650.1 hypothetical protein KC355_g6081 [Hortaea werneckii]KAI7664425.1 hypothetical protein KC318_g7734 [Hortaea werneckii]
MLLLGSSTIGKHLSASCQQVIEEDFTDSTARVVVRSCLAQSQLYPIISGHLCNGVPICPSALNADMAMVVAQYIWKSLRPKTELPGINVANLEVPRSLIVELPQRPPGQHLEMEAEAKIDSKGGTVHCAWRSVHPDGTKIQDHAHCTVFYESKESWSREWSKVAHMVRNSIKMLQQKAHRGSADIMQTGLAYKCFASFVNYSPKYRAMEEVIFDGLEGHSSFAFKTLSEDYTAPFHLDNTCHLSGFLCNAHDMDGNVYISEGWETWRCLRPDLIAEAHQVRLENYVLMQPREKGIFQGDVYVLHEDEIIAVWGGIKFKRVSRKAIDILLPQPRRQKAQV